MSDLLKQMEDVYAVLWDNKEFPICASLRHDILPAINALQAKINELIVERDRIGNSRQVCRNYIRKQKAKVNEQFESIDTLQRYHHKRYAALQSKVDELEHNEVHYLQMLEDEGIDSSAAKSSECIYQSKVDKLTEVIKRLANEELFVPPIQVSRSFGVQTNWVKEWDARIDFAKAAIKQEE